MSLTMGKIMTKYAYLYFNFEDPDIAAFIVHETGMDDREEVTEAFG